MIHVCEQYGLIHHWATPVVTTQFCDVSSFNRDLKNVLISERTKSPGMKTSNVGAWQSGPSLFNNSESSVAVLIAEICTSIEYMVDNVYNDVTFIKDCDFLLEGWGLIYNKGDYADPHVHKGVPWSGVYYIQASGSRDAGGVLELFDPRPVVSRGSWEERSLQIVPKAGLLVVFPGWVKHWVTPCVDGEERMCIAFNAGYTQ